MLDLSIRRGLGVCGVFVIFATIAGCISSRGLGPAADPDAAEDLSLGEATRAARQDAAWPESDWWQALHDPQLNRWIDTALARSPSLAEARARIRQSMAYAGLTESEEAPQLNLDGRLRRHQWPTDNFYGPGELADSRTWDNNLAMGASYLLDFWGREHNRTEAALNRAQASVAEARSVQLSLVDQLVRAYIRFSLYYAQRDVKRSLLKQQHHILELVEKRLDGGLGTELEVTQARAPIPAMRQELEDLDEKIQLSRNELAVLAGRSPAAGSALHRPALSLTEAPVIPESIPLALVGHRPDVVASRWRVAAYARDIDAARADFYPNVNLAASVGFSAVQGGMLDFLDSDKFTYSAGPVLSLPVFDGGARRSALAGKSAEYDVAVAGYRQTLLNALRGISDQLVRLHSLDKQQAMAAEAVAVAQESYDLTLEAYEGGLSDYLDVLNTEQNLYNQKLVVERLVASRLAAHAELQVALGGGLMSEAAGPEAGRLQPADEAAAHDGH